MKAFPYEFARKKHLLFYPEEPLTYSGDILEIGPGRGDFLLSAAAGNPGRQFVAIEIKNRRYLKLARRVEEKGLNNVLLIRGDARVVLRELFPAGTFSTVYVLFPDPWPKRRHTEMRLLSVEFLGILARSLRPDGRVIMATDDQDYCRWIINNARRVSLLEHVPQADTGGPPFAGWVPTLFEMKWKADGRTITYLTYRRIPGDPSEKDRVVE